MKRIKNVLVTTITALVQVFNFAACKTSASLDNNGVNYTESTQMLKNPHIGYPTMQRVTLSDSYTPTNDSGFMWYYVNLRNYSAGNNYTGSASGGSGNNTKKDLGETDKVISEKALSSFKTTLENLRKNGGSAFMRFVYTWEDYVGQEPSDFDMILTHIKQLCEIVSKFPDVVLCFECGIIGPWGEMHSSQYVDKNFSNQIMKTYLENTPESMFLLVRTPAFIANYLNITRDQVAALVTVEGTEAYRLGYYNDGYMNTNSDYGTWNNRAQEIKFLASQDHAPYGGEYGSNYSILPSTTVCLPENAIPEMYSTHVSFIRGNVYHSRDSSGKTPFGYDKYKYGSQYEKSWFPKNSAFYGVDCHTFITAHLGYRLVLRESIFSTNLIAGGQLSLSGKIENTGFANIIHNPKTQILLSGKDGVLAFPVNLNAFDLKSCTTYDYSFTVSLPASIKNGDYDVYIRLYSTEANPIGSGIQFANIGGIFNESLGANKLGTITVQSTAAP